MKQVIISRSFVEFGPFVAEEIHSFHQRGLLKHDDHLLIVGSKEWFGISRLAEKVSGSAEASKAAAKKTAKKAAKKAAKVAKKAAPAAESPNP